MEGKSNMAVGGSMAFKQLCEANKFVNITLLSIWNLWDFLSKYELHQNLIIG